MNGNLVKVMWMVFWLFGQNELDFIVRNFESRKLLVRTLTFITKKIRLDRTQSCSSNVSF